MTFSVQRITTVLTVNDVEPSLEFWEKRLGFTRLYEVPHEGTIGFAMVQRDGVEVMLQSVASVRADLPMTSQTTPGTASVLYMEVSDLAALRAALGNYALAMTERVTFYGMREFAVLEPGGHWVTFAQKEPEAPSP
jgi:uncharacterized glyoxalase superfamily protein PhnB